MVQNPPEGSPHKASLPISAAVRLASGRGNHGGCVDCSFATPAQRLAMEPWAHGWDKDDEARRFRKGQLRIFTCV